MSEKLKFQCRGTPPTQTLNTIVKKHANDRRKTTVKGSLSAQKPGS